MRFALCFLLAATAATLLAVAEQPQPQPKPGPAKGGIGNVLLDTDRLWDAMAKGKDAIVIADSGMLKPYLEQFADAVGIKNGVITRKEFEAFAQQMTQRLQGGILGGDRPWSPIVDSPMPPKNAYASEEQTLRAAGLGTDGDALIAFFRERAQPKADLDQLLELARQLGDADDQTRAKAAAKLVARGAWAVPALRHVLNELDNPKAALQARRCLEWVEGQRSTEVPIAAAKLLAARGPAGASEALLAFLPLADDQPVIDAVKAALDTLAARPGKADAGLLAALHDPLPMRRAIALEVLAGSGQPSVMPEVRKLLGDPKPQVRLRAALALVQRGDEPAVGVLIDLLAELPRDERLQAEKALQDLGGEWALNPGLKGDDEVSRKARRDAWAAWWRSLDGPAVLAAIRQRTLSKEDQVRAETLVEQLGDKTFAKRERAVSDLLAMGPKVVGLLRVAAKSADMERAHRAESCLQIIAQNEEKGKLPLAAPRLLAVRKPAGATEALLAYLPFTDDNAMRDEIGKALKNLVMLEGNADPVVVKALGDALPVRRIAAAEALIGAGGSAQWPAVRKLLTDRDPEVRLRVALALTYSHDKQAVPALIDLLGELPRNQTWEIEDLLQHLAGATAPPPPAGDDAKTRKKLQSDWQAWWKVNNAAVNMAEAEKMRGGQGLTLIAEMTPRGKAKKGKGAAVLPAPGAAPLTDRVVALDRNGQPRWQIENLNYPIDVQLLPGSRVLIAELTGNRVTERDTKGKVLWEANNLPGPPVNAQRLANGNTFIACISNGNNGGTLMELDAKGKTVFTLNVGGVQQLLGGKGGGNGAFNGANGAFFNLNELIAARKMADGHMVYLLDDGTCVRLDATGKELKRFMIPRAYTVDGNIDVTTKGHVVIAESGSLVAEYDTDGKIVWQAKAPAQRATRLANGNTLVSSTASGVTELDTAGRSVWHYEPPPGYQAIRARRN